MKRRSLVAGALAGLATTSAQTQARVAKVGYLGPAMPPWMVDLMREVLRSHGFEEGRNLALHVRPEEHDAPDRLQALTRELVHLGIDVIRVRGATAANAARAVTTSVPLVVSGVGDPVTLGFAASLARPGGTVTGVISRNAELMAKRVELALEAFPDLKRVALVHYSWGAQVQQASVRQAQQAVQRLGIELLLQEVTEASDYEPALAAFAAAGKTVFVPIGSTLLTNHSALVADAARRLRLPALFYDRAAVVAGGLMSYGVDLRQVMRGAAEYVARILKGEKPGDLPFQQIDRIELVINLRTAREIGVKLPRSLLARADEVIE